MIQQFLGNLRHLFVCTCLCLYVLLVYSDSKPTHNHTKQKTAACFSSLTPTHAHNMSGWFSTLLSRVNWNEVAAPPGFLSVKKRDHQLNEHFFFQKQLSFSAHCIHWALFMCHDQNLWPDECILQYLYVSIFNLKLQTSSTYCVPVYTKLVNNFFFNYRLHKIIVRLLTIWYYWKYM